MTRTRVKICGVTNVEDALAAVEAGADAIGLVFADSPRHVDPSNARQIVEAVPPFVSRIGVFVDWDPHAVASVVRDVGLNAIQLHGDERPVDYRAAYPAPVIRRVRVFNEDSSATLLARLDECSADAYLFDPGAGSGRAFRWELAHGLPGTIIVSGGLTAENVGMPIRVIRPFAVDVSSGVEVSPGVKDHEMMRAFVNAVRQTDSELGVP